MDMRSDVTRDAEPTDPPEAQVDLYAMQDERDADDHAQAVEIVYGNRRP